MSTTSSDAFATLGIAPTTDMTEVKRAYFQALNKHPPQKDAEGFRRVRNAYEALCKPGALAVAYLAAPIDLEAEYSSWAKACEAQKIEIPPTNTPASPDAQAHCLLHFLWGKSYDNALEPFAVLEGQIPTQRS